ncbi:hypothetical protein PVL29_016629 [Vitis rotundifolia]|uniref:DC1 domain-containing protein n=1 Tax=Vitis rotundifolia TaxID=103349 RepID=A0AA38Z904_VITRO|nr:hypothetical protein PVL29_016629 [Vitis rotundifolia]
MLCQKYTWMQMQESYNLYMPDSLYPEEIEMGGHRLRLMKNPAKTPYSCKGCKERDVRPCYKCEDEHCKCHIHKECYELFSCEKSSIVFTTKPNCDFIFHKEALGDKGVCDGCGDDVEAGFYKCKMCKKPHYLHPSCAKLAINRRLVYADTSGGEIIVDLKEESPSKCLICGNKENSDGFSGWYYISRCGKYCCHWSCMKHMALKIGKKDDDQCNKKRRRKPRMIIRALKRTPQKIHTVQHPNHGNQKRGHDKKPHLDSGNQKQGCGTGTSQRPCVKAIGYILEVALELFNIFIPLIFGLPPLPLALLLKLFK